MTENLEDLKLSIERMHGGKARFVQSMPVHEEFDGKTVWDGTVSIFDLAEHPAATRAYAWSSSVEGSDKRRFHAVLHLPPVTSPVEPPLLQNIVSRKSSM